MSVIDHDFNDQDITACPSRTGPNTIYLLADHNIVYLDKIDAIAIAKHFKLTEEEISTKQTQ